jgi:hypothetical protein
LDKVTRAGSTAVTRTWSGISRTSAFLAAVLSFLARVSERTTGGLRRATSRLEYLTRWSQAKAMRVPLGADLAGDDWVEPTLLPVAPLPPPIPPAAFFTGPKPPTDEEWSAAILAAKTGNTPAPEGADEWEAALRAAKTGNTPAPQLQPQASAVPAAQVSLASRTPAPKVTSPAVQPLSAVLKQPAPRISELRVGPKTITPREPSLSVNEGARLTTSDIASRPVEESVDAHVAAATRKAIAAALRP